MRRDPADAPVIAAALAGNRPVIVTGDRDHLKGEQLTEWLAERGMPSDPWSFSGVSITAAGRRPSPAGSTSRLRCLSGGKSS
jgi:hypothetical protein